MSIKNNTKVQKYSLMFESRFTEREESTEDIQFRVYKRRYYMLGLFSVCNLLCVMWWVSSFLIRYHYQELYGISWFKARLASLLYPILYIPAVIAASYIYNQYSLRVAMYWGVLLLGIGSCVKIAVNFSFDVMLIGQTFWAFSCPFFVNAPALLATRWFEESKRVVAITIGSNFSIIGIFIGAVIPRIIVDRDYKATKPDITDHELRRQISISFAIQALACIIMMILVLCTFQNKPDIPPSADALVYRDNDLVGTYRLLFTNKNFIKLGINVGLYFAVVTVMNVLGKDLFGPYGYNQTQTEEFEVISVVSGIVGSFIWGGILHKYRIYKPINIAIGVTTLLFLIWVTLSLHFQHTWSLRIFSGLLGLCWYPTVILVYSYSNEVAYPIKETTASGLFILCMLAISTILSDVLNYTILANTNNKNGSMIVFGILMFITCLGLSFAVTMKPIDYDKIAYIQSNVVSGSFIENYAKTKH